MTKEKEKEKEKKTQEKKGKNILSWAISIFSSESQKGKQESQAKKQKSQVKEQKSQVKEQKEQKEQKKQEEQAKEQEETIEEIGARQVDKPYISITVATGTVYDMTDLDNNIIQDLQISYGMEKGMSGILNLKSKYSNSIIAALTSIASQGNCFQITYGWYGRTRTIDCIATSMNYDETDEGAVCSINFFPTDFNFRHMKVSLEKNISGKEVRETFGEGVYSPKDEGLKEKEHFKKKELMTPLEAILYAIKNANEQLIKKNSNIRFCLYNSEKLNFNISEIPAGGKISLPNNIESLRFLHHNCTGIYEVPAATKTLDEVIDSILNNYVSPKDKLTVAKKDKKEKKGEEKSSTEEKPSGNNCKLSFYKKYVGAVTPNSKNIGYIYIYIWCPEIEKHFAKSLCKKTYIYRLDLGTAGRKSKIRKINVNNTNILPTLVQSLNDNIYAIAIESKGEVMQYLTYTSREVQEVLEKVKELEESGKSKKGILGWKTTKAQGSNYTIYFGGKTPATAKDDTAAEKLLKLASIKEWSLAIALPRKGKVSDLAGQTVDLGLFNMGNKNNPLFDALPPNIVYVDTSEYAWESLPAGKALLTKIYNTLERYTFNNINLVIDGDPSYTIPFSTGENTGSIITLGDVIRVCIYTLKSGSKSEPENYGVSIFSGEYFITGFQHRITNNDFITEISAQKLPERNDVGKVESNVKENLKSVPNIQQFPSNIANPYIAASSVPGVTHTVPGAGGGGFTIPHYPQ